MLLILNSGVLLLRVFLTMFVPLCSFGAYLFLSGFSFLFKGRVADVRPRFCEPLQFIHTERQYQECASPSLLAEEPASDFEDYVADFKKEN